MAANKLTKFTKVLNKSNRGSEVFVFTATGEASSTDPTNLTVASDIKTKYESNPDTNVYTDAHKAKLEGLGEGSEGGDNPEFKSYSVGVVENTNEIDLNAGQVFKYSGAGDRTLTFANSPSVGFAMTLVVVLDSGVGIITWPTNMSNAAPDLFDGSKTIVTLFYDGDAWYFAGVSEG